MAGNTPELREGYTEKRGIYSHRSRGGQFGEMFRPEDFAELTTPAAPNRKGTFFFTVRPPLLCEASQRRGGCGIKKKSRSHRSAADGVARSASPTRSASAKPQER